MLTQLKGEKFCCCPPCSQSCTCSGLWTPWLFGLRGSTLPAKWIRNSVIIRVHGVRVESRWNCSTVINPSFNIYIYVSYKYVKLFEMQVQSHKHTRRLKCETDIVLCLWGMLKMLHKLPLAQPPSDVI